MRKRRASTESTPSCLASSATDSDETTVRGSTSTPPAGMSDLTSRTGRPANAASTSPHGPSTTLTLDAMPPEVCQHGLAEPHVVLDDPAVGERQPQPVARRVPLRADERQRPVVDAGEQPTVLADQVEAPVGRHAERLQVDLVRVVQEQALHRGDREPGDGRHRYSTAGGGSAWPQASAPPSTTTVVPVTYAAAGEARKAMTEATSSGVPSRPAGIERSHAAICSAP